jgi:hypothetical protein
MSTARDDVQDATARRTFVSGIGWLRAFGTKDMPTPVNGQSGFAPGCTWQNPYAALGNTSFYVNVGTNLSSVWDAITGLMEFGSGTAVMNGQGNINVQSPGVAGGVSPGATGSDIVVFVYSLPANSFDQAGREIYVEGWAQFAANANTKRVKLFYNATTAVVGSTITGGTLMADTGAITQNGGSALLQGNVVKRGAANSNTQTLFPGGVVLSGSHVGLSTPAADVTAVENAPILIAMTINNTTTATDALGIAFVVNGMN